jgi:hypothetical protein
LLADDDDGAACYQTQGLAETIFSFVLVWKLGKEKCLGLTLSAAASGVESQDAVESCVEASEELPPPLLEITDTGEPRDFLTCGSGLSLNADSGRHRKKRSELSTDGENGDTSQCGKMKRADLGKREQRTGRGDAAFEAGEEAVDVVLGVVRRHRPHPIRASPSFDRPPALTRSGSLDFGSLSDDEVLVSGNPCFAIAESGNR